MKLNELRIGNWVEQTEYQDSDIPFKKHIQFDEANWYRIGDCIEREEDFNPIPLTEEWLVKFGFSKVKTEDRYWHKSVCVVFERRDGGFDYIPSPFNPITKYKYVHTLQNLYFALTGEELTININQ